ncbi:hypothetical protein ACFW61_36050 [Streptomyces microflavus]|uniref:hypothetical protein n=1 Tax=Streptomyces microflavus TaxID=1919 RepID=UPI0036A60E2B
MTAAAAAERGLTSSTGVPVAVFEIASDGRVEVTWHAQERGDGAFGVSVWLTPDQVARRWGTR